MCAQVCQHTARLKLHSRVAYTDGDINLEPILSQQLVRIHTLHITNATLDQHDLATLTQHTAFCAHLVDVDFCNNFLGPGAMVGTWLAHCFRLERLNLDYNNLQASGMRAVAAQLHAVTRLAHLHLDSNNARSTGVHDLAQALQNTPSLRHLSLAANGIHDGGAQSLISALAACTGLTRLDLSNNHIRHLGPDVARHLASVHELYLAWNQLDGQNLPCLHGLARLRRIDLTHNNLSEASVACLPPPSTLTALDLSWNTLPGLPRLLVGLQRCHGLQSLCLNYARLSNGDAEHLDHLPLVCPGLRVLELRGNLLTSTGVRQVFESMALAPHLRSLDLSSNRAFPHSTAAPAVLVRGSFSRLTRLGLSALKLAGWGAWWLRSILVHLSSLEELLLDRNEFESSSLSMLYAGLGHCTRLQTLKLSYNFLGHIFAVGLGEIVQRFEALHCLSLGRTYLTDRGLCALVHCLGPCATLQRLGLSFNALGNPSAIALVCGTDFVWHQDSALKVRTDIFPGLVHLDLSGNLIMDRGATALAAWLRSRPCMQRLVLIDNLVQEVGCDAVIRARDEQRAAGRNVEVWVEA